MDLRNIQDFRNNKKLWMREVVVLGLSNLVDCGIFFLDWKYRKKNVRVWR